MTIDTVIPPGPPAPQRGSDAPEEFSNKADATALYQVTLSPNLNTWAVEANALAEQISDDGVRAAASATESALSAQISVTSSNLVGKWPEQSGAVSPPYAVEHQAKVWGLLVPLVNVSASEPSETNGDWIELNVVQGVQPPTAIAPVTGDTDVVPTPLLEAAAFRSAFDEPRLTRRFEIDNAAGNFTSPIYSATENADSHLVLSALPTDSDLKWRCRDETAQDIGPWSAVQSFSTGVVAVATPTVTVTGQPSDVPETPVITTSAFAVNGGSDTHLNTDWQILRVSDGVTVWESLADAVNLESITVPAGILLENVAYIFRARHRGVAYGEGGYGGIGATTAAEFDIVPLMAVAHATSPFVTIYDQDIDTFTKLPNPAVLPASVGNGVAFSHDDTYMSVSHSTSPYITIYKRSGDTFTKLPNPAVLPVSTGRGVSFSSDDVYMSVAHSAPPYITIYKRSGDTFTKLPDPSALPASTSYGVAFSSDDTYMSVAHNTSPYITIYKRSGDTFTKLPDPSILPAGVGYSVAFSPDDVYMSIAHNTSPYVTIYKRSGDTFTKLPNPADLPASTGRGVSFSPDDVYMSVAHSAPPYITIYKRSGDTFTKLPDPSTLPASTSYGVAFSSDGVYMGVSHNTSPYITIYKRSGDTFTKLPDPSVLPANVGNGVAFSNTGYPQ